MSAPAALNAPLGDPLGVPAGAPSGIVTPGEPGREMPAPPRRVALDVAGLPDVTFGPRDVMWWGTMGFVAIEGFTLVVCAAVYLYLWKNFDTWPPAGTELPTLAIPTAHVVFMLASLPVVGWLQRVAQRLDLARTRWALTAAAVFGAAFVAMRALELLVALHVKWDANAYGSAQWLVVGSHATLLLIELVEIAGFALFFWVGTPEEKHFADAADAGFYWKFMVLAWIPLYVMCFWGPRWTGQ